MTKWNQQTQSGREMAVQTQVQNFVMGRKEKWDIKRHQIILMLFHFYMSQPSAVVPQIPPFEQKKREYMCAGRWQSHTHLYPAECSSQRLPERFFFSCSAKICSGSVWRQTQSRQHIAGAPHWAAHSHIRDIRQPNYIYLSKMQKVFSAFRGESRLKYAKRTGRASGGGFSFFGTNAGFMSARSNTFISGSVLL